jgi:hypothetical protein
MPSAGTLRSITKHVFATAIPVRDASAHAFPARRFANGESIMNRRPVLVGTLVSLAIAFSGNNALAQQKQRVSFKYPAENVKLTQHNVDVGDIPNHVVNVYEAHTTFPGDAPVINGLKLAETWSRGMADYIDGNGPVTAYYVYVMENGDRFFVRAADVTQASAAGMLTATTVGHITGGTGKFAGMQGIVRTIVSFDLKQRSGGGQMDIEYSLGK